VLVEVKVPQLAESVTDATLMGWLKQPGEPVTMGENLIDLETDKVTLEVTAPQDGVIKELLRQEGETVGAEELLAIIDTEGVATATAAPPAPADEPQLATETSDAAEAKQSPAVRKLIAENALDTDTLAGSGKEGRITKADVLGAVDGTPPGSSAPAVPVVSLPPGARPEERVQMTRLRKRAAERLLQAQHQSALLTTFNEVNMKPVMDIRTRYKESFEKEHGVKLGFMSFFVKAAVEALKKFPVINASVDGEDIVYHGYYDIGIAVSAPRGLVVPILRDVDLMSFADIEATIRGLGEKARDGKLSIDDLTGGTFTITNGGVFGSMLSTPIINPPQSAILGMHNTQERPVAENGEVVIRPVMYLAVSYDHRIIDGREAVQFLVTIKEQLEDPARMLLQI
jgi:2-oxoglutarate dehydrogenase E2 component (dihydrolipoamide succinyltransferase)